MCQVHMNTFFWRGRYIGSLQKTGKLNLARPPGEGKGYPLQYSGLENFMGCTVHGVAKSGTRLSDFHFFTNKGKEFKLSTSPYTQTLKKNCGRFEICPPFMGTVYITDVILII